MPAIWAAEALIPELATEALASTFWADTIGPTLGADFLGGAGIDSALGFGGGYDAFGAGAGYDALAGGYDIDPFSGYPTDASFASPVSGIPGKGGIDSLLEFWDKLSDKQKMMLGGGLGLAGLLAKERKRYGVPKPTPYSGPLSKFKYDPSTYSPYAPVPNVYTPRYYAEGGITSLAVGGGLNNPTGPVERMGQTLIGAGGMYPQSQMEKTYFATPTQMPTSAEVIQADYDPKTNPYTGAMMAAGGTTSLGSYSDGGRMLRGPGDGMSDSIPATIAGKQPARLAEGEFVVPADVVSHLGNGSTDAGAKHLYSMMDKVRKARTGTKKQGRQIKPERYLPA